MKVSMCVPETPLERALQRPGRPPGSSLGALLLSVALATASGCSDKTNSAPSTAADPTPLVASVQELKPPLPVGPRATFRTCTQGKFGTPPASSFEHRRSKAIAKLGRVAHSAQDVMARPGDAVTIPGKFAYGRVSKDLEDETAVVFLDTCTSYDALGTAVTDDDGRTAFAVPTDRVPGPGAYNVTQVVRGDASMVHSRLTIAPAGTHLVVFDVDGTLTRGDGELVDEMKNEYLDELYAGKRPPEAYPDAAALTNAWAAKGYLVVYITGRPYWLAALTRVWLDAQGCAPGHLHTTDRTRDARPTEGGVGEFKLEYLRQLIDAGYALDYVYGNAESDIFAYANAGIAPERTHIIGEHGGKGGTRALSGGYTEHLAWVAEQPEAVQPFVAARR